MASVALQIAPSPPITDSRDARYLQFLFGVCALVISAAAILYLAFLDRVVSFDEAGLYNPPYMMLHYGRMTYPVYDHFDDMVIHPPTRYLSIALFMKLGLSLFHASAVMPILFFVATALLLLFSKIPFPLRFALLFGIYDGAVIWPSIQTVRPDLLLVMAWSAGLIALEAGRLANWDSKRLFAGSALLAFAATAHYPGTFCWTGVLVYMVWSWRGLPSHQAIRRSAAMLAGLALVGIPYVVLFVVPFRHQIADVITQHQGDGGLLTAFQRHIDAYGVWNSMRAGAANQQPLLQTLLAPLWRFRVPAALIGPPLLFAFRGTRGLALAALPQVLFILLGARHKDARFSGYFAPEMIIYLAAMMGVALTGIFYLAQRIGPRLAAQALILVSVAGCATLVLFDKPTTAGNQVHFTRNLNDLDLGRAAARELAGPHPFIGSTNLGVWYTGGAADFYLFNPEILYPPTVAVSALKNYFSRFDGLVTMPLESWVTWNKERIALTSLYLSGDLQLKGFWFSERHVDVESQLSWMMYSVSKNPVSGYAAKGGRMYRFDETPEGDTVYMSAVCPITDLANNKRQFDFSSTFFFPLKTNADPRERAELGDNTPVIRTLLVPKDQFRREVLPAAARCKIHDQISGHLTEVDPAFMLAKLKDSDQPIRFYRSFPLALAGANRLSAQNTTRVPGVVDLKNIRGINTTISWLGESAVVKTSPKRWWDAAYIPVSHAHNMVGGFVYVRGKVLDGVVGISIRGPDTNTILGSEARWGSDDGLYELYIPISSFDDSEQVVIRNQRLNAASEVIIEDIAVVVEKRR